MRGFARTRDDDPVEDGGGPADDVEVAVRDRVERAGIDRDSLILARSLRPSIEGQGGLAEPAVALDRQHTDPLGRSVAPEVLRDDAGRRARAARPAPPRISRIRRQELGLGVRRVDEHEVERARRGRLAEPADDVPADDRAPVRPDAVARRFASIDGGGALVLLDERRRRGAARQRLDPGGAAAGEQVEERGAGELRLEDREQRLLDPVAQRPRAGRRAPGGGRRAPSRRSPARRQPRRQRARSPGSPAQTRSSQPCSSSRRSRRGRARKLAALVEERLGVLARPLRQRHVRRGPGATRPGAAAGRSGRGPSTSPSRRSSKSRSASSNPSRISATAFSRAWAVSSTESETRTQNDSAVAAADAAAELVELGEPEPVGALDDHHRRLRHVDADLDDGRADEHVELAVAEPGHLGVAVGGLHPAVDHPDPERREQLAAGGRPRPRRPARTRRRTRRCAVAVVVGASASSISGTTTNVRCPSAASVADLLPGRPRGRPAGGCPSGSGSGPRAASAGPTRRGRRRGPGRASAGSASRSSAGRAAPCAAGLRLELAALLDAEPVLLVDDDDAERRELDPLLDQGVRPDDDRRLARRDELERLRGPRPRSASRSAARRGSPRPRAATPSVAWCCRARRSVGARSAPCSPARAAAASA